LCAAFETSKAEWSVKARLQVSCSMLSAL
jgi:hypothetical protein